MRNALLAAVELRGSSKGGQQPAAGLQGRTSRAVEANRGSRRPTHLDQAPDVGYVRGAVAHGFILLHLQETEMFLSVREPGEGAGPVLPAGRAGASWRGLKATFPVREPQHKATQVSGRRQSSRQKPRGPVSRGESCSALWSTPHLHLHSPQQGGRR